MLKKNNDEKNSKNDRWLLTYSDMITLLMIFFIIMYTMSTVNSNKFNKMATSLNSSLSGTDVIGLGGGGGILDGGNGILDGNYVPMDVKTEDTIASDLDSIIKKNNLQDMVTYEMDERGLVISLDDNILFDTGSADVRPEQMASLIKIGNMLKHISNYIRVEGFTDDVPIHDQRFQSNWELSVIRATNVVEILVNDVKLNPEKISATGYGQYRPAAANDSESNRRLNRRVDIVIMNSDYNRWEPDK